MSVFGKASYQALTRWTVGALALALVMAATLFGQPDEARAQGPMTITFWHAMRGDKEAALRELVGEFERANPGIKVEPRFVGSTNKQWGSDYNSLYRGILEGLAAQQPPDVAMVYENWTTQLIDYGYIVPLEDYFRDGFSKADVTDLVPVFREANTYNGKMWTLPFNKSIYVLYTNKDLFKAFNATVPQTWDELRATARKLTRPDRSVYGIIVQPNVDALGHLLYAYNGEFINGNQAVFNNPLGVQALKYWVDMVNADRTAFPTFDPGAGFADGRAAMYIHTTSAYSGLKSKSKFPVGTAALPVVKGKGRHVQFAGTNLAAFKTTPERQAASWKFIRFLVSRPVSTRWALRTGYLPVRTSSIASPEFQAYLAANPDYRVAAVDALKHAQVQPKVSAWESIRGIIDDAMFEAISRRSSAQESLDRAVALSNDLIRKILGGQP
ncbi:MAG: ABC transporter substrate-binding protein [Armatimonadetes bacterium]|nr:ABC transporter substrate-binding protein [Armatimonadota bacterium]